MQLRLSGWLERRPPASPKLSSELQSGAILLGPKFLQSPEKKTPSDDYPKLVGRTVQSELIRTRQIVALSFRIALWMATLWR